MATNCRSIRTFVIMSAIAFTATVASGQSAEPGTANAVQAGTQHHTEHIARGSESIAAHLKFGMTRAAAIDADLKALVDDMNMFVGEIKIETMAQAITLLVDRLSIMREQMMAMHQLMMNMTAGPTWVPSDTSRPSRPAADEAESGTMCLEVPF